MSSRNVKLLAVAVLILFGILFALNSGERSGPSTASDLLFPELKARLNDINIVTITDAEGVITLRREADDSSGAGRWIAPDYDGYPADTGSLRSLLLDIADARKVEQKTSDPELYGRLGVEDPREEDSDGGVLVSARGDNASIALILGDTAQGEFRYARIPEEAPSWLISRNPPLPADRAGWLLPDIVDIDSSRIESAVIRHADGEVISLRKANADETNFEVENVPEGRELRYPSVANGIGAVLGNLTLEEVRRTGSSAGSAPEPNGEAPPSTAEFRTFDGLEVLVSVHSRPSGEASEPDDAGSDAAESAERWITLEAAAGPAPADVGPADSQPQDPDVSANTEGADAGPAEAEAEAEKDPADEAAEINNRVSGWMYRIADYKADQLTRRWEDLLSAEDDEATD